MIFPTLQSDEVDVDYNLKLKLFIVNDRPTESATQEPTQFTYSSHYNHDNHYRRHHQHRVRTAISLSLLLLVTAGVTTLSSRPMLQSAHYFNIYLIHITLYTANAR